MYLHSYNIYLEIKKSHFIDEKSRFINVVVACILVLQQFTNTVK